MSRVDTESKLIHDINSTNDIEKINELSKIAEHLGFYWIADKAYDKIEEIKERRSNI